ncbi:dihydrodipicolinate synthase family protein [Bacillus sp. FJAT-45350]|uniref:dihydrodipicolinate synthase family protein n=1 Tax=Bacillus sp. FJAT-45350 TaxID=2011014 RepID=UPI000BB8E0F9|nr:dihydrodipicolinate synthase family protein [Bacillus sp. FJAT-45350]
MEKAKFHGVIPPVSTIFDANGKLDKKGMGTLIEFLIDSNVQGLFFLGTGGEFSQMSIEERKDVTNFAIKYVNGRLPVLIGTGSSNTREVIELNDHAKEAGADAVVVINPYYWTLSEQNLIKHYAEIAEATDLPIILYNFPALTGQDLTPEIVVKLADTYRNIIGIKDTVDSAGHIREMILKVKSRYPEFSVLAGFDEHLFNTLGLGGDGVIPASANFLPELTVGIYEAFEKKDYEKAVQLHQILAPVPLLYKIESPFISIVKEAIRFRNIDISTTVLAPSRDIEEDLKVEVKQIVEEAVRKLKEIV